MQHVQSSLDNVVTLLQQRLPGPSLPPDALLPLLAPPLNRNQPSNTSNTSGNFSLEQWVQQVAPPINDYSSVLPSTSGSGQGISTRPTQLDSGEHIRSASPGRHDPTDHESDDEDDVGSDHTEGLGLMRGMLKQDASRRLVADGHTMGRNTQTGVTFGNQLQSIPPSLNGMAASRNQMPSGSNKRSRSATGDWTDATPRAKGKRHATSLLDPIHLGLCTEHEGARLFDL